LHPLELGAVTLQNLKVSASMHMLRYANGTKYVPSSMHEKDCNLCNSNNTWNGTVVLDEDSRTRKTGSTAVGFAAPQQ